MPGALMEIRGTAAGRKEESYALTLTLIALSSWP